MSGRGSVQSTADLMPVADGVGMPEAILEAALDAFAQRGYDGMSVRELNRQIGASHNLVHHYFGSKDALWRAAIDFGLGRVTDGWDLKTWAHLDDPVEILQQQLRRFLEITARSPALQRILEREASNGGSRLDYMAERYIIPHIKTTLAHFEATTRIEQRGLNMSGLVLLVASGTTAYFTQSALARKLGGSDPFSAEAMERHIRTMIDILFYGLLGKPPVTTEPHPTMRPDQHD